MGSTSYTWLVCSPHSRRRCHRHSRCSHGCSSQHCSRRVFYRSLCTMPPQYLCRRRQKATCGCPHKLPRFRPCRPMLALRRHSHRSHHSHHSHRSRHSRHSRCSRRSRYNPRYPYIPSRHSPLGCMLSQQQRHISPISPSHPCQALRSPLVWPPRVLSRSCSHPASFRSQSQPCRTRRRAGGALPLPQSVLLAQLAWPPWLPLVWLQEC